MSDREVGHPGYFDAQEEMRRENEAEPMSEPTLAAVLAEFERLFKLADARRYKVPSHITLRRDYADAAARRLRELSEALGELYSACDLSRAYERSDAVADAMDKIRALGREGT